MAAGEAVAALEHILGVSCGIKEDEQKARESRCGA